MIHGLTVVAVVPARGGSKSIPGKNVRALGGRPLLCWAIDAARRVSEIDRIIVSTDDAQIAEVARAHEAETYRRSAHLATDDALVIDALRELQTTLKSEGRSADIMVLLEPTCPLRSAGDIRQCITRLVAEGLDSIATFKPAQLNPHRAWRLEEGRPAPFIGGSDPWQPRQQLPPAYQLNGAVYAFYPARLPASGKTLLFGASGAVIMPESRSVDIDQELDFLLAEMVLARSGETDGELT